MGVVGMVVIEAAMTLMTDEVEAVATAIEVEEASLAATANR